MAEKQSNPVPLRPPHRPMERRLRERFVIDPKDTAAKPIIPLHSDRYGKLAVGRSVNVISEYQQRLEDQAYI